MKVLFIGGTGNISAAVSRLCLKSGVDLYLLNRGQRKIEIKGAKNIYADVSDFRSISTALNGHKWDAVVNWIAFEVEDLMRDFELFSNTTEQYIFISSASVYHKPPLQKVITELTPLKNPFWNYSRKKIECELKLHELARSESFPVTIVRPSLTYDTVIPVPFSGWTEYTLIDRMKRGEPVIVHNDGNSLWTMTHSSDFARGFFGLIGNKSAINESFHITSDEVITWNRIFELLADAVGVEPNLIHIPAEFICSIDESKIGTLFGDKVYDTLFDNSKIKIFVPDYNAVIPFKSGIKQTINWFEESIHRRIINNLTNVNIDKIISAFQKGI